MDAMAVVLSEPERLGVRPVALTAPGPADIVAVIRHSGISTGTERLLYRGTMPAFPGMGYPLVPGYESVGEVVEAGPESGRAVGESVFVPGAACYGPIRGLFGGAASRVVLQGARALPIAPDLGANGVLLALAATAHHAVAGALPDLIVGHGALGRLAARICVVLGGAPVVWETRESRITRETYQVLPPDTDPRRDYRRICDMSGDAAALDGLVGRLAPGGEIVLAGFYDRISFAFAPAFMREARFRVAAQWQPADLRAVADLVGQGRVSLDGIVTHRADAADAPDAYRTAFDDPDCLKMVLDWSTA